MNRSAVEICHLQVRFREKSSIFSFFGRNCANILKYKNSLLNRKPFLLWPRKFQFERNVHFSWDYLFRVWPCDPIHFIIYFLEKMLQKSEISYITSAYMSFLCLVDKNRWKISISDHRHIGPGIYCYHTIMFIFERFMLGENRTAIVPTANGRCFQH